MLASSRARCGSSWNCRPTRRCAAVEAGLGATAISATVAAPSIESGLLHQGAFRLPERAFHVLRHHKRYRSRAADALLALMLKA